MTEVLTKTTKAAINRAIVALAESIDARIERNIDVNSDDVQALAALITAVKEPELPEKTPLVGFVQPAQQEDGEDE